MYVMWFGLDWCEVNGRKLSEVNDDFRSERNLPDETHETKEHIGASFPESQAVYESSAKGEEFYTYTHRGRTFPSLFIGDESQC